MRSLYGAAVLILGVFLAAPAQAANCKVTLTLGVSNYSFNSGSPQELSLTVSKSSGSACTYFIGFSKGSGPSYANREMLNGTSGIGYQLYLSNPFNYVLEDVPQANSDNFVLSGIVGAGKATQTLDYWAVLGSFSYPAWGLYKDSITVTLYNGTVNGSYQVVQTQTMTFQYNEPKAIDLSMVPSGGAFDLSSTSVSLNFGTLSQGEAMGFDCVMMYNAGYALSVSSQNKGEMAMTGTSSSVPYTLSANGVSATLTGSNPTQIATGTGTAPTGGTRVPIAVTIGSISNALAGSYSDYLTFTVTSTE